MIYNYIIIYTNIIIYHYNIVIIVVARYNENIEWTKQFPNVIIYNKGQKLNNDY